jgi:hypothetical protein
LGDSSGTDPADLEGRLYGERRARKKYFKANVVEIFPHLLKNHRLIDLRKSMNVKPTNMKNEGTLQSNFLKVIENLKIRQ